MNGWQEDKNWSDKFLPEIKSCIGANLIGAAPIEDDQERNTDLIVLKLDAVRIACRIRRKSHFEKYGMEFTIREGRPSGVETEMTKLISGWGDYLFYGFGDDSTSRLVCWRLCNLNHFRLYLMREMCGKKVLPGVKKMNADNSSSFRAFKFRDMPEGFVVASMVPEFIQQ